MECIVCHNEPLLFACWLTFFPSTYDSFSLCTIFTLSCSNSICLLFFISYIIFSNFLCTYCVCLLPAFSLFPLQVRSDSNGVAAEGKASVTLHLHYTYSHTHRQREICCKCEKCMRVKSVCMCVSCSCVCA